MHALAPAVLFIFSSFTARRYASAVVGHLQKLGYFLWNFVLIQDLENFATASRSRCQQNSSTTELVDDTADATRRGGLLHVGRL